MKNQKNIVFTHYDLDGVVSYLVLKWILKDNNLPYITTTTKRFREDFTQWLTTNKVEDYEKIYITDLDVSSYTDLIDKKNVCIIDHHKTHQENQNYKNATAIIKEYPSAAELIYKVFRRLYDITFSNKKKKMVLYASDYDSYQLRFQESENLNKLFWTFNKGFETFIKNFINGFYGFSVEHLNIIAHYDRILERVESNLIIYEGTLQYQDQTYKICATFGNKYINDIAAFLLKNCDIAFVVNTQQNHVSVRRKKSLDIDLTEIVLTNFGTKFGGHHYATGGELTEEFLEFTKTLKQIK